jgi:beta-phosphoglucomutase-like phosphatase (HAD superfamily)
MFIARSGIIWLNIKDRHYDHSFKAAGKRPFLIWLCRARTLKFARFNISTFTFLFNFAGQMKKSLMQYDIKPGVKGLIFDLDGTLVDSMPLHLESWKKACNRFGIKIDSSLLRLYTGSPGWVIAAAIIEQNGLNGSVTVDEIIKAKLEESYKTQHLIKPIEPVAEIVHKYYGILPMAVGSGGHREAVESSLEVTGMRRFFEIIVTANDVSQHKPHPETFLKCADLMKVDPKFIEVFEDGDLGLQAAVSAGMIATDVRSWYDSHY